VRSSRKPTLSDVARRAGVSSATASYILNDRSAQMRIAPDTQARVRQAAADLGYRPNPAARSLRTASTRTVGMISDFLAGGHFASQMITGASNAARARDHVIVVGESGGDPELESLLIEEMLDRRVDGIVYATVATKEIKIPAVLEHQRTVLLNCVDRSANVSAVVPDEYQGGRSAAEQLLGGGVAGEIHVVGEEPTAGVTARWLRMDGLRDGLRVGGRTVETEISCDWSVPAAYDAVHDFLASGQLPGALVCLNDRIAMGAYQALTAHSLRVPDDVSVVSFDGSDLARWLRPELTSIVLPYADLGSRAVELLLSDGPLWTGVERLPMPVSKGGSVRAGRA
jgi:LacI family transcriptional regulator